MGVLTNTIDLHEIGPFLSNLFGLEIKASEHTSLTCEQFGAWGVYVDNEGAPKGYLYCDLDAGAKLGAALTQIPPGAAEDAVASGSLPENLQENLSEVLNIAVNLFPAHLNERMVLSEVLTKRPEDGRCEECLPNATCVKIDIQRYGEGGLYLFIAD